MRVIKVGVWVMRVWVRVWVTARVWKRVTMWDRVWIWVREGMGDKIAVLPVVIDAVAWVVSSALIDFAAADETNNNR